MTTPSTPLPELDDARIAAMERELFARIADEPAPAGTAARPRRGRVWLGALGGAAATVAVLVVAPVIAGSVVVGGAGGSSAVAPAFDGGVVAPDAARDESFSSADGTVITAEGAAQDTAREVIATGSATVRVDDVAAAIALIGQDADARGGYVESTGTDAGAPVPIDGGFVEDSPVTTGTLGTGSGYITIRVPSDQLADATSALSEIGEVTSSSVSRQDVTDQAIDLRARVESLEATVDRLNALIAQAQSVADVIAVESELSARQADLESYRQQLQYLEGQVSLSSLTVTVVTDTTPVTADPAGFGDGLAAGWNGLVATLNGLVIAVGFLLPWVAVAGVAALIVWLIVRGVRRRRASSTPSNEADAAD